jgi:hypothetical protein
MSFWKQNQKLLLQRWDLHRRRIEREVAERRRDLVRRNMRQSSEWNSYEPYTDWYLEREVEAFVAAVDEVSSAGPVDIDDESLDDMDRMLLEMIDRRCQLAPSEALREMGSEYTRVKGSARVGLLKVQSQRRSERERGYTAPPPPVRRKSEEPPAAEPVAAPPTPVASPAPPAAASPPPVEPEQQPVAPEPAVIDVHYLADNLRRLAQLIQRLPVTEEQAESMEELQFVAEEATAEPMRRKLRMVAAALERIKARIAAADPAAATTAAALANPIRRWFEVSA